MFLGNSLVQLECGGSVELHIVSMHSFDARLHEGGQPCDVLQVHSSLKGFRTLLRREHKTASRRMRRAGMHLLSQGCRLLGCMDGEHRDSSCSWSIVADLKMDLSQGPAKEAGCGREIYCS